jgi:hypothetical protein
MASSLSRWTFRNSVLLANSSWGRNLQIKIF